MIVETKVIPEIEKIIFENVNDVVIRWKAIICTRNERINVELADKLSINKADPNYFAFIDSGIINANDITTPTLVVFDQFEQIFSLQKKLSSENDSLLWVNNFIESAASINKIKILIIIRKEYFYDLKFLESCPSPNKAVDLSGIKNKTKGKDALGKEALYDTAAYMQLSDALFQVTSSSKGSSAILDSLKNNDGEILPVEAQIVGLMVENISRDKSISITPDIYNVTLGGKEGLISRYFEWYLQASPNKDVAEQVLFALSVETGMKRKLTSEQISDIIHESESDVKLALKYFKEEGLVRRYGVENYEVSHDFIAEKFHEISGSELDPAERDNIIYFWHEVRKHGNHPAHITKPRYSGRFCLLSDTVFVLLVLLITTRLLGPLYGQAWDWFHNNPALISPPGPIDMVYAPIFVAHFAWAYYVTMFYRRFFGNLNESLGSRYLSGLTVIVCAACVSAATIAPQFWVISIGVGGLGVGVKLWSITRTKALVRKSKEKFLDIGLSTIGNSMFVIILGIILVFAINNQSQPDKWLIPSFCLLSIVMIYFMFSIKKEHISRSSATRMMGLIDRKKASPDTTI